MSLAAGAVFQVQGSRFKSCRKEFYKNFSVLSGQFHMSQLGSPATRSFSWADKISDSVVSQEMHSSVMETP